ncbi:MAG: diguanylate cyclase [Candidatus Kapaibacterium sp.]|nr:MAG: diguanylate cyclase [Candidatus Kapabacteria bacterium]
MHEAALIVESVELSPHERYRALLAVANALIPPGTERIAAMANLASLLYHSLPALNWCGFYRLVGERLIVGPFQGKPACVEIPIGRGICGRAAALRQTVIVRDVTSEPDHIACDPASRSEIVVPLLEGDSLVGVLDLDSPSVGRFSEDDAYWLGEIAGKMLENSQS